MKKERILSTAARLFAERGFARTSTSLLAREAGVAEGTIFRHFKSKDAIFLALLSRLQERITKDVYAYLDISTPENGMEHIISVIKACYIFVSRNPSEFLLMFRDAPGCYGEAGGQAFASCQTIYQLLQEYFARSIRQGQREGCIRTDLHPDDTACVLASSLVGLMRVVHLGFLNTSEEILQHFLACARAMLEVRS